MTIVLRAGPGLDILFAGRAGSGPHNSVCGPGPVCTSAAGPGRVWASNHICGPGLGPSLQHVDGVTADIKSVAFGLSINQVCLDSNISFLMISVVTILFGVAERWNSDTTQLRTNSKAYFTI